MSDVMEGIFSFYWIDPSGITRMRWYRLPAEGLKRSEKDELLSGFLTALMSFSREMFGNELAHLDLLDFKIFFGLLPSKDILALVTTKEFNDSTSKRIMNAILERAKKVPITIDSCEIGSMNHFIPELEKIIDQNIPKSLEDNLLIQIEQNYCAPNVHAYLFVDQYKNITKKQIKTEIDFDLSTFLESVFWEKEILLHKETSPLIEKTFFIPSIRWIFIQIPICNMVIIFTPNGYASLIFDIGMTIKEIEKIILGFDFQNNK